MYEVEINRLPVRHEEKGAIWSSLILMAFALVVGGLPTWFLIWTVLSGDFQPEMLSLLLFSIVGLVLFGIGLKKITTRRVIEISESTVKYQQRSIFGRKSWEEALSNYKGVWSHSVQYTGSNHSSEYTVYKLDLLHPNRKRRLALYASRSSDGLRARQQNYCRQLQVPALEGEDEENLTVREVEDIGKSVGELAREGRIDTDFDPSAAPPPGLQFNMEDEQLRITLPRAPRLWLGVLTGILVAGGFLAAGTMIQDAPGILNLIGVGILLATIGSVVWEFITEKVLTIAPDFVHVGRKTPWGDTKGRHIPAAAIQTIRVGRRINNQGPVALLLGKDDLPYAVGAGLPKETLEWLRNCVLAIVSKGA